jgi:hypothetical protein
MSNRYNIDALLRAKEEKKKRIAALKSEQALQREVAQLDADAAKLEESIRRDAEDRRKKADEEQVALAKNNGTFKTRICAYFTTAGGCRRSNCPFAHGDEELVSNSRHAPRHVPSREKTVTCRHWAHSNGTYCPFGDTCMFLHDEQLQPPPPRTLGAFLRHPTADTASAYDGPQSPVSDDCDNYDTY